MGQIKHPAFQVRPTTTKVRQNLADFDGFDYFSVRRLASELSQQIRVKDWWQWIRFGDSSNAYCTTWYPFRLDAQPNQEASSHCMTNVADGYPQTCEAATDTLLSNAYQVRYGQSHYTPGSTPPPMMGPQGQLAAKAARHIHHGQSHFPSANVQPSCNRSCNKFLICMGS